MYSNSKTLLGKKHKGSVTIEAFRGRLRLRFRFNGQRYSLGLELPNTSTNWRVAEIRARQIEDDMRLQLAHGGNYFDTTLAKYKPESSLSVAEPDISPKSVPKLKDLWEQYMAYKSSHASPKTVNGTYQPIVSYLEKCPTDGLEDALKFRLELLQVTTESQARRALMESDTPSKAGGLMSVTAPRADVLAEGWLAGLALTALISRFLLSAVTSSCF